MRNPNWARDMVAATNAHAARWIEFGKEREGRRPRSFPSFSDFLSFQWPDESAFRSRLENDGTLFKSAEAYWLEHVAANDFICFDERGSPFFPKEDEARGKCEAVLRGLADALSGVPGAGRLAFGFRHLLESASPADRLKVLFGEANAIALKSFTGVVRTDAAGDAVAANDATLQDVKAQGDRIEATATAIDNKVDALIGRGADNEVTPSRMAQLITEALKRVGNYKGITGRTVQNWVAHLKTGGERGTRPPEGFNLNTLRTLKGATDFARDYATADAGRLKVHMAFNEHDSRLEEEATRRFGEEEEERNKRLDG